MQIELRSVPTRRPGPACVIGHSLPSVTPEALDLVSLAEMESLSQALHKGRAPRDLIAKLARLRTENLQEHYLQHQSQLLLTLLLAATADGSCRGRPQAGERLVQMLAYVRKDDDAIPDSWPDGFVDDHDLMRLVCAEFRPELDAFKSWHLSRNVARLW